MRWIIGIVVVVVLAVLGYEYFRPASRPPVAEGTVQPSAPAADSASPAAPPLADQPPVTDKTRELEEQAAIEARQAAEDASRKIDETAERVANAAQDVASTSAALTVGDTDLGKGLTDAVNGIAATLGGITDQASAEAAVPKLVEIDARLYELKPKIERLQGDARKTLATLVTGMLPKVQSAIDQLQATTGEVVKPVLDPIVAKLNAWSHEPA